jgi:hypothetical protein
MKHTHITPRVIERINAMRTGRRGSAPPPPHRIVGKHPALAAPYGGKLQDQVNQLRNIDYALIERRMMAHLR